MGFVSAYSQVTVSGSAVIILASNPLRKGMIIVNVGAGNVYFGMDVNVTTANGLLVITNGSFNMTGLQDCWRGDIYAISASTSDLRAWEWGP